MAKEGVDKFINDLLIFIEDDYLKPTHNFNRDLKYSVKELDEHYNCGYRDLFDMYYTEFLSLKDKGNYQSVSITYDEVKDDYLVKVSLEQMVGAQERKEARSKELAEILEREMKLVEEGKLDEVSPATLWIIGKL